MAKPLYISTGKGQEKRYCCPFCLKRRGSPDTKYHLYYDPDRAYKGEGKIFHYKCFRCGATGERRDLAALIGLAMEADVTYTRRRIEDFLYRRDADVKPASAPCPEPPSCQIFPGSTEESYLLGRGFTRDHIKDYGLRAGTGELANRIVIPIYEGGNLVYWQARSIDGREPKYRNPKDVKRDNVVYRFDEAAEYDRVLIVEGPLTAIAAGRNAVATLGKEIPLGVVRKLLRMKATQFIVCLDDDALKNSVALAGQLKERRPELSVSVFIPPRGKDAVDLGHDGFLEALMERTMKYERPLDGTSILMEAISLNGVSR